MLYSNNLHLSYLETPKCAGVNTATLRLVALDCTPEIILHRQLIMSSSPTRSNTIGAAPSLPDTAPNKYYENPSPIHRSLLSSPVGPHDEMHCRSLLRSRELRNPRAVNEGNLSRTWNTVNRVEHGLLSSASICRMKLALLISLAPVLGT